MAKLFQLFIKPNIRKVFSKKKSDVKKAVEVVNNNNGIKDLYRTIYEYTRHVEGQNAMIDKVYLDFDPTDKDPNGFIDVKKVSHYLSLKNISHKVFFSGRGFHIFVETKKVKANELINPQVAIRNFAEEISDEADCEMDWQVVGDLMRVARIPNTLNLRTRLFCIPLSIEELGLSIEDIQSMAGKQRKKTFDYVGEPIDLRDYDNGINSPTYSQHIADLSDNIDIKNIPTCVAAALQKGDPNHQERYMIITCLRDLGYSSEDVREILRKYLESSKFIHCDCEENQIEYLFNRQDLIFPSCYTIKQRGYHVGGCTGNTLYF